MCRTMWAAVGYRVCRFSGTSRHSPLATRHFFLTLAFLILCVRATFALDPTLDISQYAHTSWKVRDGFVAAGIGRITQTPDGYLWLGTQFGLYRFDGVRAVPWQPPAGQQLPDSIITALLVARDGTLWIGTFKGLASWKDGKLTLYSELAGQFINDLLEDRESTIWVAGSAIPPPGKLCAIRNGAVQCEGENGMFGIGIVSFYEDRKGNLWAGAPKGFWRWKPGRPEFFSMPNEDYVMGLAEDEEGNLLIGVRGGIKRMVNGRIDAYPVAGLARKVSVLRLLRDRDGALWIGTYGGGLVHVHQGKTDVFSEKDGLSGDEVSHLVEDREGNIWSTTGNGLDRFRPLSISTISTKQGLLAQAAYSLCAKDGRVWIGTDKGLDKWNHGEISAFGTGKGVRKPDGRLNGEIPQSLFQDSSGQIWVSTPREFGRLDGERFVPVHGLPSGIVHDIAETGPGHLWLAYQEAGLLQLFQGKIVRRIPWAELKPKDFGWTLAADPSQKGVWVGFLHGDVGYVADDRLRASYSVADGLGRGTVNALRFGPRGTLWAATEGGLSRIKDGRIATLTSRNGLPCDRVHWTIEDDDHFLWVYMPCGLVRIARSELDAWVGDPKRVVQTTVFGASDGVATRSGFATYASLVTKSPDGKIWFTPYDGISVIDPRHLPVNKLPPPVQIEQIIADRKTYDTTSAANRTVRMPPQIRDLEIDYTALSLVVPEKVRFRYKLEGFDRDWQDPGTRRQAFYTNLPPRNYRFRVAACNNSGVWNEAGATLDFSIAPAYYQTRWFQLLCVLGAVLFGWMLYRVRVRRLANAISARFDERLAERTRVARELHDTLLQTVLGSKYVADGVLLDPSHDPGSMLKALEKLSGSLDLASREARDALNALRASTVQKNDLAAALRVAMEDCRRDTCIETSMQVSGDAKDMHPVAREEVYRIGYEAVRNACAHSQAKQLELSLTYGRDLTLRVSDNGVGIDPVVSAKGRDGHFGLHGMRERAARIGGQLTLASSQGSGTKIILVVPGRHIFRKPGTSPLEKLREVLKGQHRPSSPD